MGDSKIIQLQANGGELFALCGDGSVWLWNPDCSAEQPDPEWECIHAPCEDTQ